MDTLPALPEPFPQLDFPATEQLRQAMVGEYRDMLVSIQDDVGRMLEDVVDPVLKSRQGFVAEAMLKQSRRRKSLVDILKRLGARDTEFADGGRFAHTSDEALRLEAKRLLADARKT